MKEQNESDRTKSYLSFSIGEEIFAIEVSNVLSILEVPQMTSLPNTPEHVKGVINLRGQALLIMDTSMIFGVRTETKLSSNSCILVLDLNFEGNELQVGALVDSVREVLEVSDNELLPAPKLGLKEKSDFIVGMVKQEEKFTMIINPHHLLSDTDGTKIKELLNKVTEEQI